LANTVYRIKPPIQIFPPNPPSFDQSDDLFRRLAQLDPQMMFPVQIPPPSNPGPKDLSGADIQYYIELDDRLTNLQYDQQMVEMNKLTPELTEGYECYLMHHKPLAQQEIIDVQNFQRSIKHLGVNEQKQKIEEQSLRNKCVYWRYTLSGV